MLKGGGPPIIIPRSQWWIPEESIVESSYNGLLGDRSYQSSGGDRDGVEMWQFRWGKGQSPGVGVGEKNELSLSYQNALTARAWEDAVQGLGKSHPSRLGKAETLLLRNAFLG